MFCGNSEQEKKLQLIAADPSRTQEIVELEGRARFCEFTEEMLTAVALCGAPVLGNAVASLIWHQLGFVYDNARENMYTRLDQVLSK